MDKVLIGRPFIARKLQTTPPAENEEKFNQLLEKFFAFSLPKVFTAQNLAIELAKRTRFLRDEVISIELEQHEKGKGQLYGFYEVFKKFLIANLTEKDFADLFSQTITYGLFAARTRSTNGFNRKLAYDLIPKTIGILRNVFRFISQGDLTSQMEVMVDDIAEVLNAADVNKILHQYYTAGKGEDPIVHFYETFLNIYDPATREKRGVYYTPEPVVRYIVRSIHDLLKTHFDLPEGLASKDVTVLDPAGGTLTFPAEAIKIAVKEFTDKYGEGGLNKFISGQILKNFYAFELMMAPYAIGHIKISFLLEELGYEMKSDERFKLYLTNTLDMEDLAQTQIPGLESLSEESHEAGKVKQKEPILVIMGNPPYSGHSANYNPWTKKLMKINIDGAQSYYEVDDEPLGEKNSKWLQDDYVKFLRFAQWKIQKAGRGIVGMITNHSYLDNPTFKGMRQSLMKTFDKIYLINLHGNSKKNEIPPEGGKDENVFDIMQGVAIIICVKKKRNLKGATVHYEDLWGGRNEKYKYLNFTDFEDTGWKRIYPKTEHYLFIPRNEEFLKAYDEYLPLDKIFKKFTLSIQTHRDKLVIDFDKDSLIRKLLMLRNKNIPDEIIREAFGVKDTNEWNLKEAREKIMKDNNWQEKILPIIYRPFDRQFVYYDEHFVDRMRKDIMENMFFENYALLVSKQQSRKGFYHALVTQQISESCAVSNKTKEGNYHFPLYIGKETPPPKKSSGNMMMLFEDEVSYGVKPNLSGELGMHFEKVYGEIPGPEKVFFYIYAVLYSNIYREKYAEFLKIDFPRIPFTGDYSLFLKMAELGEELAGLHLLKAKALSNPIVKYKGTGEDIIAKPVFDAVREVVFINDKKYFEGITQQMWTYHIGGYQVLEKYLKDRKGRQMTDSATYCKIATAIQATINLQTSTDEIFADIEKKILDF